MQDKLFSAGDFAKLTRTTIATLHHYDKIGLLSPIVRGENKYRYYSVKQLAHINMITTLQKLGVPLSEIKVLKDKRTPELSKNILIQQLKHVYQNIDEWIHSQKLLSTMLQILQSGLDADHEAITTEFLPAIPVIMGAPNDYSNGKSDYDALFSFYSAMHEKYPHLDLNYPVWGVFSAERIKRGDFIWPDRYYFYNPDGFDLRPAALYAIGHMRTAYGKGYPLYHRMLEYIDRNGLEICGDTYEEYPFNELFVYDDQNYLMRLIMTVREKSKRD